MKRAWAAGILSATALAVMVRADVKTTERVQIKFGGGFLGAMMNRAAGDAAKEGVTQSVAVKGNRLSSLGDATGQIIDLSEQKVYDLDVKKKEYKVTTFEELRKRAQEAKEKAEKDMKDMPAEDKQTLEEAGKEIEFTVDVKETGEKKPIAGHNTREVILTITAHEKGKKIDESGGFILTNDLWIAPKIAALDEIGAFYMKFFQAVYGDLIDMRQMAALAAMFPSLGKMNTRMQAEAKKLDGTPLMTTTTFETVKSAEQMKAAQGSSSGGGGLSGRLASRIMRRGPVEPKSTLMTSTNEKLSIQTSATAEDVAIPTGFKEKK
jgi:hypothetical protein